MKYQSKAVCLSLLFLGLSACASNVQKIASTPTPASTEITDSPTLLPNVTETPTAVMQEATATPNPSPTATLDPLAISPTNAAHVAETGRLSIGTTFEVAWTADGMDLVRVDKDGLYFYDPVLLEKQKFIQVPEIYTPDYSHFTFVRYNPNSQLVVRCNVIGDFNWWNVTSGEAVSLGEIDSIYRDDPSHSVTAVQFSPDGKLFAVDGIHGEVLVYPLVPKTSKETELVDTSFDSTISISGDDKLLAKGGGEDAIHVWNIQTRKIAQSFENAALPLDFSIFQGFASHASIITFSPDGRFLAWATKDKSLRLGDVTTGQILFTLSGHTAEVWNLTFSPNGQLLASGSEDGTIRLWDVTTGKLLQTLSAKAGPVYTLAFSPDGKLLASGHKNTTVVWGVKP